MKRAHDCFLGHHGLAIRFHIGFFDALGVVSSQAGEDQDADDRDDEMHHRRLHENIYDHGDNDADQPHEEEGTPTRQRAFGCIAIEAHRADDVRYALRLHEEFKFDFTLLGAGRAGPVVKELAASGITVALGPVLNTSNDLRRDMKTERLAGVYARAGIPLVISSGAASAESSRYLRMEACAAAVSYTHLTLPTKA